MSEATGLCAPALVLSALILSMNVAVGQERLYAGNDQHPRLLCTAAELDLVRSRLDGEVEAIAYERLLEKCDSYLDPASPHYVNWPQQQNEIGWDGGRANLWEVRAGAWMLTKRYEELAWAGVLSGEQKYIDGAKNIVLTIIRERVIDRIGGTNYGREYTGWLAQPLDAGHSSRSLAVFYDLLYDHLSEEERAEVREYITGTYLAYLYPYMTKLKESDRYPAILGHNMHLIGNAAGGLMALAIYGEGGHSTEQENAWVNTFFEGIEGFLGIGIGEDGGALEGPGYTGACLYYSVALIDAMRRAGGKNLFESPALQKVPYYYLYELRPNGAFFNNINDAWFSAHTVFFPLFAGICDDPALTWLWEQTDGWRHDETNVFGDTWSGWVPVLPYVILWHALAPEAKSPDELGKPLSRKFSRRGLVSMRTGWGKEGCLFSFLSGGQPDQGHAQYDANHFALYCGESILAYDSGYGARDTDDHNSLLFDGKGQTVRCNEGRIIAYEPGEIATYACGRAGDLYDNEALKEFDRHVYFVRGPHGPYAVVYDEVEADGAEHSYTWLLNIHANNAFELSGEHPVVVDEASGWQMDVLLFASTEPEITTDMNETKASRTAKVKTHPRLRAEVKTDQSPAFLALLYPRKPGAKLPQVTRLNDHALRVAWPDYVDLVAFGPAKTAEAETQDIGFMRTKR